MKKIFLVLFLVVFELLIATLIFSIFVAFFIEIKTDLNLNNFKLLDYISSVFYAFITLIFKESFKPFILSYLLILLYTIITSLKYIINTILLCMLFFIFSYLLLNFVIDSSFFNISNLNWLFSSLFSLAITCVFIQFATKNINNIISKV